MNELTDSERIRVAHHEAGHALVAELLGVRVDVVSVRAAERHRGVTIHASLQVDEIAELLARRDGPSLLARWGVTPYPFFDPEERRRAECLIMISLAGRLGELLMPEFSSGYRDDSADTDQAQAIATAAELTAEQEDGSSMPNTPRSPPMMNMLSIRLGESPVTKELQRSSTT